MIENLKYVPCRVEIIGGKGKKNRVTCIFCHYHWLQAFTPITTMFLKRSLLQGCKSPRLRFAKNLPISCHLQPYYIFRRECRAKINLHICADCSCSTGSATLLYIVPVIQTHFGASKLNPLPDDKILDWSKLKQIADNILKCI